LASLDRQSGAGGGVRTAEARGADVEEGAGFAEGFGAACAGAVSDEECVVLVEERGVGWQAFVEEGLVVGVALAADAPAQTVDGAARVRVDDERGPVRRVEDDIVGGLFADSPDPQKAGAEFVLRQVEARVEAAFEALGYEGGELLELAGLGVEVAGRADDDGEAFAGRAVNGIDGPDAG